MKPTRSEGKPLDRAGILGQVMLSALESFPEFRDGDRAIAMIETSEKSCLAMFGYEDDAEAGAALISHLKALFEANGQVFLLGFGETGMDAAVDALEGQSS
jgi:hypothetical protein